MWWSWNCKCSCRARWTTVGREVPDLMKSIILFFPSLRDKQWPRQHNRLFDWWSSIALSLMTCPKTVTGPRSRCGQASCSNLSSGDLGEGLEYRALPLFQFHQKLWAMTAIKCDVHLLLSFPFRDLGRFHAQFYRRFPEDEGLSWIARWLSEWKWEAHCAMIVNVRG